jgi:hypothetical protein
MFSPPKISWVISGIKYICLRLLPVFYLIQPSSKQIICFDFRKQNSVLPIVFYVPWLYSIILSRALQTFLSLLYFLTPFILSFTFHTFVRDLTYFIIPFILYRTIRSYFIVPFILSKTSSCLSNFKILSIFSYSFSSLSSDFKTKHEP